ncbi:MAG: hypothetical protein ED559_00435 [Phycisphaera sp.]|nr:MAG: hypothetical protein ED559_00435 [Phycisphaera sp.]
MRRGGRSFWLSLLLALWYALAALPALPVNWAGGDQNDVGHNPACKCVSCAGGDACCCVPVEEEEDDESDGPNWASVDCSVFAGWLLAKKAPAVVAELGQLGGFRCHGASPGIGYTSLEGREIGVPEPPPRLI